MSDFRIMTVKKLLLKHLVLACLLTCVLFSSSVLFADAKKPHETGYTINFENVSIKEFLKFVSKIGNLNVIYNDEDLDFNVTIVSEEEADLENIMSALVQILRIHNLTLIEEDQNLLIHNNADVRQIPTVVSEEVPFTGLYKPAIMTKVFKIYKGNPSHIAALLTPMLSKDAIVEVSMDTRQLIITDVSSSIQTIEELLLSLDAPETPFDVTGYESEFISVVELADLVKKIIKPISDGTTLELIPQVETGTLFIVSTPFLIERTISVLKELDRESLVGGQRSLSSENVLIHKLQYRSPLAVESGLKKIASEANAQGFSSPGLDATIKNGKFIQAKRSMIFIGTPADLEIIDSLLKSVDSPTNTHEGTDSNESFYIFEPKKLGLKEASDVFQEVAKHLSKTEYSNPSFLQTLRSGETLDQINAIMFTGEPGSIAEVKAFADSIEQSYDSSLKAMGAAQFYIYNIKEANEEQIRHSLNNLSDYLVTNHFPNSNLIKAIDSMRWIKSTNSLMFTGHGTALNELADLLPTFDVAPDTSRSPLSQVPLSNQFIIYSPTNISLKAMHSLVEKTIMNLKSADLADPAFLKSLESMREFPSTDQLLFTGDKESLAKLESLLQALDKTGSSGLGEVVFVPIKKEDPAMVVKLLHNTATKLENDPNTSSTLIKALKSSHAVAQFNAVVITGTPDAVEKVKSLINLSDQKESTGLGTEVWLYTLKNLSTDELHAALNRIAEHADALDPSRSTKLLINTINSMQAIPDTKTIQFVGNPDALVKLQKILEIVDKEQTSQVSSSQAGGNFLVYKVKHSNPQELLNHIRQLIKESTSGSLDTPLYKMIKSARYVKDSSSLLFTGTKENLDKIQTLLLKLDVANGPADATPNRSPEGYKIYRPEYVAGPELIGMLKNFEDHLVASGVTNERLAEVIDHLSYVNRANSIIVTGDEQPVEEVLELLKKFDTQELASGDTGPYVDDDIETIDDTGFLIYKLQHQSGEGIVDALSLISKDLDAMKQKKKNQNLIDSIRSVQWISITNSLIATGEPKILTKLKELIESIDRPLKQVFIEILVVETTDTNSVEFGLQWGSQGSEIGRVGWGLGNFNPNSDGGGFPTNYNKVSATTVPTGSDSPPIPGGFLGIIGDLIWHDGKSYAALGSLMTALKEYGNTTVVLSQKIVAQDNQNAKIFTGDNIPFTGSLVTTSGLSQTTNANLEYRNIGVTLNITPIIGDNDIITLDIDHEISEEANSGTEQSSGNVNVKAVNGIRTSKTSMKTRVHLPDRHFLVLSGSMRNKVDRSVTGIPCLGGLPLIGAAFSDTQKSTLTKDVIIFVKPQIIKSPSIYGSITKQQEELYNTPGRANVDDFNAALELIRSADDEDDFDLDDDD